jgi:hypothetical protein
MFPKAKAKQLVKATLDRFVEDRLAELKLTRTESRHENERDDRYERHPPHQRPA